MLLNKINESDKFVSTYNIIMKDNEVFGCIDNLILFNKIMRKLIANIII